MVSYPVNLPSELFNVLNAELLEMLSLIRFDLVHRLLSGGAREPISRMHLDGGWLAGSLAERLRLRDLNRPGFPGGSTV
jgi:hypothetical protein